MKIEVLYIRGCPHHLAAVLKLREVLAAEGVAADISEVAVDDMPTAVALRFSGSPTIRVNGRDVAAETACVQDFAVACRLYPGSKEPGVPATEMIWQAVRDARVAENP